MYGAIGVVSQGLELRHSNKTRTPIVVDVVVLGTVAADCSILSFWLFSCLRILLPNAAWSVGQLVGWLIGLSVGWLVC